MDLKKHKDGKTFGLDLVEFGSDISGLPSL
jgi:hypothetical protein